MIMSQRVWKVAGIGFLLSAIGDACSRSGCFCASATAQFAQFALHSGYTTVYLPFMSPMAKERAAKVQVRVMPAASKLLVLCMCLCVLNRSDRLCFG